MGAVCAGGVKKDANAKPAQVKRFSGKLAKPHKSLAKELDNSNGGKMKKNKNKNKNKKQTTTMQQERNYSGELLLSVSRELKPSKPAGDGPPAKVTHKTSFLGKAGTMGLEKTLEVLDTLGSSMSNLNARSGFISGMPSRGNKISILAFEVANTISKGANLFQSLSEENVNFLTKEILHSEGVKQLVSTDMKELLAIAASDKREEFDVFSREVIRFGDLCKDPQWHNLGRYFPRLDAELSTDRLSREEAELTVHELTTLVQHTSELYHELHSLDRFEQDYHRKVEELHETVKHPAVPLRPSSSTSKSESTHSPRPTVDAYSLILLETLPSSKHANVDGNKDRAKNSKLHTSIHERLSPDKREDTTNVCGSSTSGKAVMSRHHLNGEIPICSNTMQVTIPAEDSNHEVADADPRRNNVDFMFKNSVGICETEKESSRHEQTKESTARAKSMVSGQSTDACASKKGHASGQDALEGDDGSLVSSESAEILVKNNNLRGSRHDGSNGLRRRKPRKIRLLSDLLSEGNGVGNANAPKKTADLPSGVSIPDASATIDKPPGSPSRVVTEGSDRRSLLPNKKRKVPQDEEWSTPDMSAHSRVSKEARTSKKAVDITKINNVAGPCDVVTQVKDKMALQSSTISNSSKIRSENSAGKGKKIVNTESAVTSELAAAGVKCKSSTKNNSKKTRGDNNAAVGKKKDKSIFVADEHLSLAPPSSLNLATVTASSIGDACKANTTDHAVPKSLKNKHARKEIDLFPLPTQKVDEISISPTRQFKSGQVGDLQGPHLPSNLGMLGEDLSTREAGTRIPTWRVSGPTNPLEDLSNERELSLSLHIHPAAQKSERPFNSVKDKQGGTSKDQVMSENGQEQYLGRLSSTHRSPMLAPYGGVQSDSSRKQPIIGLPFLSGTKNHNSPTDMGGSLIHKKNFGSTNIHDNPTGFQKQIAAKVKDVDQRGVRISEQEASDDIPMEIVELMAKNQYERCLPDVQAERYRPEATSRSSKGQTMEFGNVYGHLNMHPYYQEAYNERRQTNNGRNGIIHWGENARLAKQKSVAKFPQVDQNRFFIYQPDQSRSHGSYAEFLPRQKPSSMANSASSSSGEIGDQSWRLFGDVSMKRQPQTSSHPTGPWNVCHNIPQQQHKDAYHLWRNSVPSHNLPFIYNVPQKNASLTTHMDGILPCSASIPKASINRDSDLINYPNRNVSRLHKESNSLDSEMPSKERSENQLTCNHHNVVELNQQPTGNLDIPSDENMSAMQLLTLMNAGLSSNNRQVNQDVEPKLPIRPSTSLEQQQHSGIGSTSHKDNGKKRTLPYGYVSNNQFTRGVHTPPTFGSSFQLDRGFSKAIDFTRQVPQSTSSSFKIPSESGPKQTMLLGSSDSYRIPFQIPSSRVCKEQMLEASITSRSDRSSKRKLEPDVCLTNRNPADFSYPAPDNPFMIGAEDLKFLDAGVVNQKRQKKKVAPGSRGRVAPRLINP